MPINLGDLPSNKPIPRGRVQIKRGAADVAPVLSSANNGQTLGDGASGYMQISYTPTYPCLWIVKSNVMAHGYPDGAGWRRWDHAIGITPADAQGNTGGFNHPHQLYDNSSVEWRTSASSAVFRLNAGVTYTAYLYTAYVTAGSVRYHAGPAWCRIIGVVVGEGQL